MASGQTWLSLAAQAPPCHLLSRLFQGCWRQGGRGLAEPGGAWGVAAASVTALICVQHPAASVRLLFPWKRIAALFPGG